MVYKYGRIHDADLYAHFSSVGLINDTYALKDWGGSITPNDSVGTNENIWSRLKKVGDDKFYKPDYGENQKSLSLNEKREKEKEYVHGDGKKHLMAKNIAETNYINKMIDVRTQNVEAGETIRITILEKEGKKI